MSTIERATSWWLTVGGGTSDFSLFELRSETGGSTPRIKREDVDDHIPLGGDNASRARRQPRLEEVCDREIDT